MFMRVDFTRLISLDLLEKVHLDAISPYIMVTH